MRTNVDWEESSSKEVNVHDVQLSVLVGVVSIFADGLKKRTISFKGAEDFVHFDDDTVEV